MNFCFVLWDLCCLERCSCTASVECFFRIYMGVLQTEQQRSAEYMSRLDGLLPYRPLGGTRESDIFPVAPLAPEACKRESSASAAYASDIDKQ